MWSFFTKDGLNLPDFLPKLFLHNKPIWPTFVPYNEILYAKQYIFV